MNFSVAQVWTSGPLALLFGLVVGLAPLLFLALAWRPARRGSSRGVWWAAGASLVAFALPSAGAGLALPGPFDLRTVLAFPLLLAPVVLACAAVLHVAIRKQGGRFGIGVLVAATVVGYLALPIGVVLAVAFVVATLSGH